MEVPRQALVPPIRLDDTRYAVSTANVALHVSYSIPEVPHRLFGENKMARLRSVI